MAVLHDLIGHEVTNDGSNHLKHFEPSALLIRQVPAPSPALDVAAWVVFIHAPAVGSLGRRRPGITQTSRPQRASQACST
jgi:hypothetical protein